MADPEAHVEFDQRIAIVRDNLRELVEQAAAYSGAADEARNADRIADQEAKLAALLKERAALGGRGRLVETAVEDEVIEVMRGELIDTHRLSAPLRVSVFAASPYRGRVRHLLDQERAAGAFGIFSHHVEAQTPTHSGSACRILAEISPRGPNFIAPDHGNRTPRIEATRAVLFGKDSGNLTQRAHA